MANRFNADNYYFDAGEHKWIRKGSEEVARASAVRKIEAYYKSIGKPLPYTQYKQPKGKSVKAPKNPRAQIPNKIKEYFRKDVQWKSSKGGHLQNWAKPLTITGGEKANYDWNRRNYYDPKSPKALSKTHSKWGADVGGHKGVSGGVLNGTKDFVRHFQIAIHAVEINAANFRIAVGQRAMKVFQNSFTNQRFYNKGARRWRPLVDYTKKKRARRGTGNTILDEYGDLKKSIKLKESVGKFMTQIYTDVVPASESHHKKHSICYAGYHNEGKGQYGRAWNGHKPHKYYTRRFMGHSSHLDPYNDAFMMKMMKLYLFDNVFLVKK